MPSRDPVKCPDCHTWWRGKEHRCPDRGAGGRTVARIVYPGSGTASSSGGHVVTVTDTTATVTYNLPDDEPPQRAGARA